MNSTEKILIVIGRQYGSGGREIAKALSESLSIPIYDKRLLDSAAERYGYSKGIFLRADEKKPAFLRSLLSHTYGFAGSFSVDALSDERIYELQSSVIRDICENESCIIVGRTADYVMRHHPNMISVFVHAPLQHRAGRILHRGDAESLEAASSLANKKDSSRKKYYNYFTGRRWGEADNYHISIDSSLLPIDKIVKLINNLILLKKES